MKIFYSEAHRAHPPPFEVFDGGKRVPYLESPDRIDRILAALKKTDWAELAEPTDFGLDPIMAVHDKDYIMFLASCWTEWLVSDPQMAEIRRAHVLTPITYQNPMPSSSFKKKKENELQPLVNILHGHMRTR